MKQYYFENTDDLINHIYFLYPQISGMKLQKTLYFLYAYYSGIHSAEREPGISEMEYNMPSELFKPDFKASAYGPVISEVYEKEKYEKAYSAKQYVFGNTPEDTETERFIYDIVGQVRNLSDFDLTARSHEDSSWRNAYEKGRNTPIPGEKIKEEYRRKMHIS